MSVQPLFERNQEATIYIGNVDLKVNEEILWELFVQCGPVVNVHIPRDKITGDHQVFYFPFPFLIPLGLRLRRIQI